MKNSEKGEQTEEKGFMLCRCDDGADGPRL